MSHSNSANQEMCVDMSSKSYGYRLAIPNVLETASETKLSVSSYCIKFFYISAPYSIRELIIGTGYESLFILTMIGYGIYWSLNHQSSTWGTGNISCEIWHLLSVLLVLILFSGVVLVAGRWYKNRKRKICNQMNKSLQRDIIHS
jgi:hypothetical protein